jgi:hypothetical protein
LPKSTWTPSFCSGRLCVTVTLPKITKGSIRLSAVSDPWIALKLLPSATALPRSKIVRQAQGQANAAAFVRNCHCGRSMRNLAPVQAYRERVPVHLRAPARVPAHGCCHPRPDR